MFLAAVAHYYVFSHTPFVDPDSPSYPCWASFTSMFDISDVRQDMSNHVRVVGRSMKDTVLRTIPRKTEGTERAHLLSPTTTSPSINDVTTTSTNQDDTLNPDSTNPKLLKEENKKYF